MQGQLALLLKVPDSAVLQEKKSLTLFAAPPGTKEYPSTDNVTESALIEKGWTKVAVPYSIGQPESFYGGIQARRIQYGLRPRIASTIHAAMGSTCGRGCPTQNMMM